MPPRRTLLVGAAVLALIGGTGGLVAALTTGGGQAVSTTTTRMKPVAPGKLHVTIRPDVSGLVAGELVLVSQVDGPNGMLGTSDCTMLWREFVRGKLVHTRQTECGVTVMFYDVKRPGVRHYTARATSEYAEHPGVGTGSVRVRIPSAGSW